MKTLEATFNSIMESSIFRLGGLDIDLCDELTSLAHCVRDCDKGNDSWLYLGECLECTCADLITGAYWALSDWHGGQYSDTYATLCALSEVFSPNMSSIDEECTEYCAYQMICAYFESKSA